MCIGWKSVSNWQDHETGGWEGGGDGGWLIWGVVDGGGRGGGVIDMYTVILERLGEHE
jgi:hypothetical protein